MGRRRKGDPIHGWVVVDKPLEISSTGAVNKVRWLLHAQKAGHTGTLDPLATGILVVALGEATKLVNLVMNGAKTYRFTAQFGEERTTDDAEGEVTATSNIRPTDVEITAALPAFTGDISQIPPAFSAIKVAGERAYKLARAGQEVHLAARPVHIESLTLIERPDQDHVVLEMRCGKGTYVRSLVRDLARSLGTCAHVVALRRTRAEPFGEDQAFSLEKIEEVRHKALIPIETALDDIPALALTGAEAAKVRQGQAVSASGINPVLEMDILAKVDGKPLALGSCRGGQFFPKRVLLLDE